MKKLVLRPWAVLCIAPLFLSACTTDNPEAIEADEATAIMEPITSYEVDGENPIKEIEQADASVTINTTGDETEVSQEVKDWFPPLENVHYIYEGEGNEYAPFDLTPQYAQEDAWQVVEDTGGMSLLRVYNYTEDEIQQVFTWEETYFRENYINPWNPIYGDEEIDIILQAPIEVGHAWDSPTGAEYEITDVNVEIETPSGAYDAIEVTRSSGGLDITRYYVEGIGLVHQSSEVDPEATFDEVTSTLAEIHEDVPEVISMIFYTLDEQAEGIDQILGDLKLYTNDEPRIALAEAMKGGIPEMADQPMPILTPNVEINHLYLDLEGVVNADFSQELISEMNAGSGVEALILQSIVNTLGDYYDAQEVLLTVEGRPYSSGHIELKEGETLSVDHTHVNLPK